MKERESWLQRNIKQPNATVNSPVAIAPKNITSICDHQQASKPGMTMSHMVKSTVVHPVVVVKVAGYKFRALLDSRASHSYASSTYVNLTKAEIKTSGVHQIAMLVGMTTRMMKEYNVTMHAVTGKFALDVNVTKVDKRELLQLENPKYKQILNEYPHLRGVHLDNDDDKKCLPVHLILGATDFEKIKTGERLQVGRCVNITRSRNRFITSLPCRELCC